LFSLPLLFSLDAEIVIGEKGKRRSMHTTKDDTDWHSGLTLTLTSGYFQKSGAGRKAIANAKNKEAGWNQLTFSDMPAATVMALFPSFLEFFIL
jgi:hypothetical protein